MVPNEHPTFSLDTRSRRYERYAARIGRVRQMLDTIRRHRVPVGLTAAGVLGLVLCFLGLMGHFTGEVQCPDYVYGNGPGCWAQAFLSDVEYEFSPAGGEPVWSADAPVAPGEYRVRAVSKNGYGVRRYSEEVTFTLSPRPLTVSIDSSGHVYGDAPEDTAGANTHFTGLAPGDRAAEVEYTFKTGENGGFSASLKAVRIVNGAGQDVTAGYALTTGQGDFTMTPRPITVSAGSGYKEYDGQPWYGAAAQITGGTLAYQDRLAADFGPLPAEVGTYELIPTCRILDGEGNDVTGYYAVTVQSGALTVAPRQISVQTMGGEKAYDGTPLTDERWSVVSGEPLPGHTLTGQTTGSQTAAGESPNTVRLTVLDEAGADVSANYLFNTVEGTLKVTPIHLRFETDSAEQVYDGQYLRAEGCRLVEGELVEGHELLLEALGRQRDVGSSLNNLKVTITDSNGKEVTQEGYTFQVDYGVLTVTPRAITVESGSAQKLYDGLPLTCSEFEIVEGSLADYEKMSPTFTGSQTQVGSSPNYFRMYILNGGTDISRNYDITYIYGTLTVHENPDLPQQGEDKPQQGGDPGEQTGIGKRDEKIEVQYPEQGAQTVYAWVDCFDDLNGPRQVYFRDASYGEYTGSGWAAPGLFANDGSSALSYVGTALYDQGRSAYLELTLSENCPRLFPYYSKVFYDLGMDNDCYLTGGGRESYGVYTSLGYSYQDLKGVQVVVSDIQSEATYRQHAYQAYLHVPETTRYELLNWAAQHGISEGSATLVEDIQHAIQNAAVYNLNGTPYPQGVDVAVYFLTQAREGICQHFATAATLMYRAFGIPARYTVGFVDTVQYGNTTELTNADAHAWVEIYVNGLGWVPIEVTGSLAPEDRKTELHLQAYSAMKYYDGQNFEAYDLERYTILSGALKPGHRLEATFETGRYATTPGDYVNRITKCVIYDETGADVTDEEYNVYLYSGKLTILNRKITITMGSASKEYDGQTLTCPTWWISEGSLAPGDTLTLETDSALTDPGRVENFPYKWEIWGVLPYGGEVDVTYCYEIEIVPGYLNITLEDTA